MCLKHQDRQAVPVRVKETACSQWRPNMRVADCATVWVCKCLQLIYLSWQSAPCLVAYLIVSVATTELSESVLRSDTAFAYLSLSLLGLAWIGTVLLHIALYWHFIKLPFGIWYPSILTLRYIKAVSIQPIFGEDSSILGTWIVWCFFLGWGLCLLLVFFFWKKVVSLTLTWIILRRFPRR